MGKLKRIGALEDFLTIRYVDFIPVVELNKMIDKVDRHQIDLLLDVQNNRYWVNSTSPKGYLLEQLLLPYKLQRQALSGSEIRYVDWVIPGVLGMNIMFSALFGVGYVIVRYRKNGVLKRLRATPLSAFEFISAQIASRLLMIVAVTVLVYVGTDLVVDFRMVGSYWLLFLILIMGALSMISVGLLVAARITSEEAANGLLNLMSWPHDAAIRGLVLPRGFTSFCAESVTGPALDPHDRRRPGGDDRGCRFDGRGIPAAHTLPVYPVLCHHRFENLSLGVDTAWINRMRPS